MKTYMSSTVQPCLLSHGLQPETVTATTADGKLLNIPFSNAEATTSSPLPADEGNSEENQRAKTLYLLDRFAVSDQFYHELAQVCEEGSQNRMDTNIQHTVHTQGCIQRGAVGRTGISPLQLESPPRIIATGLYEPSSTALEISNKHT